MTNTFLKSLARAFMLPAFGLVVLAGCSPVMTAHLETGKQARKDGDYVKAVQNLKPLSDFGLPEAQYELAMAYMKKADATPAEKRQAHDLLNKLAESGNPAASFELARYYEEQDDFGRAAMYYAKSAQGGNEKARFKMASSLLKKRDATVAEKTQARDLLIQLSESGNQEANIELARFFRDQEDLDNASVYYLKAGESGNAKAYFELAAIEEKKKNYSAAIELYKKSFDGQYYRSAMRIARMYEKGIDGQSDLSESLRWYQAAEKEGVEGASEKVAEIQSSKVSQ